MKQRASRPTPLLVRVGKCFTNNTEFLSDTLHKLREGRAADRALLQSLRDQLHSKGQHAAALEQALQARELDVASMQDKLDASRDLEQHLQHQNQALCEQVKVCTGSVCATQHSVCAVADCAGSCQGGRSVNTRTHCPGWCAPSC